MKRLKFRTNYHVDGVWYEKGTTHELSDGAASRVDPANVEDLGASEVIAPVAVAPEKEEIVIHDVDDQTAAEKEHTKPVKRIRRK